MTLEEKNILWEKVMGIGTYDGGVEHLFEEGKPCAGLYSRIAAAQGRLLAQLNLEESRDIIEILNCEDEICRLVSLRMFDYGMDASR